VAGKMKKPHKTSCRIAARGVTQVPRAADTSQITEETSCPKSLRRIQYAFLSAHPRPACAHLREICPSVWIELRATAAKFPATGDAEAT